MKTAVLAVAYSAGRDSTALLHATWRAVQAHGDVCKVVALHVHHGLSTQADAWLLHAQNQCQAWADAGAPLQLLFRRLDTQPAQGESVEAWARRERYRALTEMAHSVGAEMVLLAHHQQDQAETFLLQALRGAGVAGLASMPGQVRRAGLLWVRPWLARPRRAIEAYVAEHGLSYVDDDSNSDTRFARNRLRHQVWPALADAFPQVQGALFNAASWAHEAQAALQELAELDLKRIGAEGGQLPVMAWQQLSDARRSNALRHWLAQQSGAVPSSALLQRLKTELAGQGAACWQAPGGQWRRYRGCLRWVPHASSESGSTPIPIACEERLRVTQTGDYALPGWGGLLRVSEVGEGGTSWAYLRDLSLRPRSGGEQFQAGAGRPPRRLKKQYQAAAVPEWARHGPLFYAGPQLVFVPGLGLDARVWAQPGQTQVQLDWLPRSQAV